MKNIWEHKKKKEKNKLIITGSAEPKLIIGPPPTPPLPGASFRLVGTEKVGLLLYLLVFLIDHLTPRELESQSKSHSPGLKPCLEFWEPESECRLDRETGSSLHYARGCTSIDYQDLK